MEKTTVIEEKQKAVLKRINEDFLEGKIASVFNEKGEEDTPANTVRALIPDVGVGQNEVLAQFAFVPNDAEEADNMVFDIAFTIDDNLDLTGAEWVSFFQALSYLNFYLPYGSFSVDATHQTFIFKYGQTFFADQTEDELLKQCQLSFAAAFVVLNKYIYALLQVSRGQITLTELVEMILA